MWLFSATLLELCPLPQQVLPRTSNFQFMELDSLPRASK
jgi:hypothetical protein